jgi:hypothetical protein
MNPGQFLDRARRIEATDNPGSTACDLIVDLMRTRSQWTEEAILSLLRGDHVAGVAGTVSHSLLYGLRFDDGMSSFVGSCFRLRRLHLLCSVASVGIPAVIEEDFVTRILRVDSVATTDAGVWLDALSAISAFDERRSFPMAINDWAENPAAHHCADLLLRLDPNHPHIAELSGTPLESLLTESRMRARLYEHDLNRLPPERPAPARRPKTL